MCKVTALQVTIKLDTYRKARIKVYMICLSDRFDVKAAGEVCNYEGLNLVPKDNKLGPFDPSNKEYVERLMNIINARAQQRRCCYKNHRDVPEFYMFLVQHKHKNKKGS